MRLILSLFFISSVLLAKPCDDYQLKGFERFLKYKKQYLRADKIQNEEEIAKICGTSYPYHEKLISEIDKMLLSDSYKKKFCEVAIDFCMSLELRKKASITKVGDEDKICYLHLIIKFKHCIEYFPIEESLPVPEEF